MDRVIGIDFGTTNSVVATIDAAAAASTMEEANENCVSQQPLRTVLCFWKDDALRHAIGSAAIQAYLDAPHDSRLIMSMKTYLAQKSFRRTNIFGAPMALESMIATFVRDLTSVDEDMSRAMIVVGRPVRFAGDLADDSFGESRLRAGFAEAGLSNVHIALEPAAAGYRFVRKLDRPATVLVGDFGGGTSDFSVLRFDPGREKRIESLSHAGVGIAGDVFDFRIIDNALSPLLGKGGSYKFMGKELPIPADYFSAFAHWHRLSLMAAPRTLRDIEDVARACADPAPLRQLIRLIEDGTSYKLYQTVSDVKAKLSREPEAVLRFSHGDFTMERAIAREEFERWIAADIRRMSTAVDQALNLASVTSQDIDRVFLTGGTSFVPAVKRLFIDRFGDEKISAGGEFVSVAEGLALIGQDQRAA